jgi:hypothetical protein
MVGIKIFIGHPSQQTSILHYPKAAAGRGMYIKYLPCGIFFHKYEMILERKARNIFYGPPLAAIALSMA